MALSKDSGLLIALAALLVVGGLAGFLLVEGDSELEELTESSSESSDRIDLPKAPSRHVRPDEPEAKQEGAGGSAELEDLPAPDLDPEADETSLFGEVHDQEGRAVAGVKVELRIDTSPMARQTVYGDVFAEATTDREGRYDFGVIRVIERLCLRAEHGSYADKLVGGLGLEPGFRKQVDLTLLEGATFRGLTLTQEGEVLPGVEVIVIDQALRAGAVEGRIVSGADGRFELKHLNAGPKRAWASKEGFATAMHDGIYLDAKGAGTEASFKLGQGSYLEGRVLDQDGQGVEGVQVLATPKRGPDGKPTNRPPHPPVLSGANGVFRCEGLREGRYLVSAKGRGFSSKGAFVRAQTPRADLEIVLQSAPLISGTVVDAESGEPVPSFSLIASASPVLLQDVPGLHQRFQDETGRFEFAPTRGSGRIYLFAKAPGFAGGRSEVIHLVQGENPGDVEIRLGRGGYLRGRIIDSEGKAIARATIELTPIRERSSRSSSKLWSAVRSASKTVRSGPDGRYELRKLLAGLYELRVSHRGHAPFRASDPLRVSEGEGLAEEREIVLNTGGQIVGRAEPRAEAVGAEVVTIQALGSSQRPQRQVTESDGSFRFERLAPGLYEIWRSGKALARRRRGEGPEPKREIRVVEGAETQVLLP